VIDAQATDDRGASAVEYGILIAAIAGMIVAIVFLLDGFVHSDYQKTCDEIAKQSGSPTCAP
jgi:pilus assembly protein Flp/PilA